MSFELIMAFLTAPSASEGAITPVLRSEECESATKWNITGNLHLFSALDGSSYSFEIGNDLRVPKLLTDQLGVVNNILAEVERIGLINRQIRGRKIGQSLFDRGCLIFAHVKDPVACVGMSCRQDNRGCNVLDVSVGPPPLRMIPITMDGCKVSVPSTAVNLWQTNHCRRQGVVAENRPLHEYFVVVVMLVFRSIRFTAIRIKSGSQRRIFPQRPDLHRSRLKPCEARIRKINIPATDGNEAPSVSTEGLDCGVGITLAHRNHVDYGIGSELEQLVGEDAGQARTRTIPQVLHRSGKKCFGLAPMKHTYLMPGFGQLTRDMRANEAGTADHKDSHEGRITQLLCRPTPFHRHEVEQ